LIGWIAIWVHLDSRSSKAFHGNKEIFHGFFIEPLALPVYCHNPARKLQRTSATANLRLSGGLQVGVYFQDACFFRVKVWRRFG
jgi:hypothetical protein